MMAGLEWVSVLEEPQEALISSICTFGNCRVADQPWQKTDLKLLRENTQAAASSWDALGQNASVSRSETLSCFISLWMYLLCV